MAYVDFTLEVKYIFTIDSFLGQDQVTYVQTAGTKEDGYALEYQQGDLDHHYRISEWVSYDQVLSVFKRYAKGDETWKTEFDAQ